MKKAISLNLSLEEFLMLTYFDNDYNNYLNMELLCKNTGLNIDQSYEIFNKLLSKKLITIDSDKDTEGRMIERVNLNNFYNLTLEEQKEEDNEKKKTDIYSAFETEFGRTITSMEYEIINAWLEKGYTEELIKGALKEAVFNGVSNLRYIDKILYEWNKKGFKAMKDVNNHLYSHKPNQDKKELFDYNWLDDD